MTTVMFLVVVAAFLNWLFWVTPDPALAGLFLAGSAIVLLCAVAWFADVRRSRR